LNRRRRRWRRRWRRRRDYLRLRGFGSSNRDFGFGFRFFEGDERMLDAADDFAGCAAVEEGGSGVLRGAGADQEEDVMGAGAQFKEQRLVFGGELDGAARP
jgi:hypothetical protein